MFDRLNPGVPEQWGSLIQFLIAPIGWIPSMQRALMEFFLDSSPGWAQAAKFLFLLFPAFLWVAAIWCTQLSIYTLPFRSGRLGFLSTLLFAWWDAVRVVWVYWVGLFRIAAVAIGWLFGIARLAVKLLVETVRQFFVLPFAMTGRMTQSYFKPGVPWVAFLMLLFWCSLESLIFTYTLFPTVSEVLGDLVGVEAPQLTGTVLYLFLLFLILGSFACIQALTEAARKKEMKFLVQLILVELFVMFFEVMFLYRELVDAITPWIAQQTGERFRMGIVFTLSLATFGWMGVRGMTWFLFGQFGTPPLLAFISRRPLAQAEGPAVPEAPGPAPNLWRGPIDEFKAEIGWLHEKSDQFLEYLTLPVLQVLAAALNFALVLVASRPVFSLPFKHLGDVMETRELVAAMRVKPKTLQPKVEP